MLDPTSHEQMRTLLVSNLTISPLSALLGRGLTHDQTLAITNLFIIKPLYTHIDVHHKRDLMHKRLGLYMPRRGPIGRGRFMRGLPNPAASVRTPVRPGSQFFGPLYGPDLRIGPQKIPAFF